MQFRQGDRGVTIRFVISSGASPVDLTGATVTLVGKRNNGSAFGGVCSVVSPLSGEVSYMLTDEDTSVTGVHSLALQVSIGGTVVSRLPRQGDLRFVVSP